MPYSPRPIEELAARGGPGPLALLCDLDDTITTRGRLRPEAFAALWDAADAGLPVIVVTGRPAGWADHLARMWPVHGVIAENGGLWFRHVGGGMRRWYHAPEGERRSARQRLEAVREEVLREVPGCAIAADQTFRELDLAVDFAEDVPPLPREEILRIRDVFLRHGARAKISSIHVNGWFGDFDKLTTSRDYLRSEAGIEADDPEVSERVVFVGDSPNDEPMFAHFPVTVGVAGIADFASLLEHGPSHITPGRGGAGFSEAVAAILAWRRREGASSASGAPNRKGRAP